MMLEYPIRFFPDAENATVRVTSPDVPEFTSWGKSIPDAQFRAEGEFLKTLQKHYVQQKRAIPVPTRHPELMESTVKVKFDLVPSR